MSYIISDISAHRIVVGREGRAGEEPVPLLGPRGFEVPKKSAPQTPTQRLQSLLVSVSFHCPARAKSRSRSWTQGGGEVPFSVPKKCAKHPTYSFLNRCSAKCRPPAEGAGRGQTRRNC